MKAFDSLNGAVSVSQRAVYRGLALFPVLDFRKELFGHTFNVLYMAQTLWAFHQQVLIYLKKRYQGQSSTTTLAQRIILETNWFLYARSFQWEKTWKDYKETNSRIPPDLDLVTPFCQNHSFLRFY